MCGYQSAILSSEKVAFSRDPKVYFAYIIEKSQKYCHIVTISNYWPHGKYPTRLSEWVLNFP